MNINVAVSGGFDPLHIGHLELLEEARERAPESGDKLIVILNNDNWLRKKKGYAFMPEEDRRAILLALDCVDEVILTSHTPSTLDMSICTELKQINPDMFCNGGDRTKKNTPEKDICKKLGIVMEYGIGGKKAESSSELVEKASLREVAHKINESLKEI